ncbi:MAG: hypothetical protein ABSH36_00460 [Solirubrobacteraceae bacterium]
MNTPTTARAGYRYIAECIQVMQMLTETQFRAIEGILDEPLGRFKGWADHFVFSPHSPPVAQALREYLCAQGLPHTSECEEAWEHRAQTESSGPSAVRELVALASHRALKPRDLEGETYDAAAEAAGLIIDAGIEDQIGYLVQVRGLAKAQRVIERARRHVR